MRTGAHGKSICLPASRGLAGHRHRREAACRRVAAGRVSRPREVRGEGLILGVDLEVEGAPYVAEALKQGLLINCTHDHILRLLPPFILTAQQVKEGLNNLESVFAKTERPAPLQAIPSTTVAAQALAAAR